MRSKVSFHEATNSFDGVHFIASPGKCSEKKQKSRRAKNEEVNEAVVSSNFMATEVAGYRRRGRGGGMKNRQRPVRKKREKRKKRKKARKERKRENTRPGEPVKVSQSE